MKTKDIDWYDQKLESIKKRKRNVHRIEDPKMRKRIKADLKREQRGAKRAERQNNRIFIEQEINEMNYGNKD